MDADIKIHLPFDACDTCVFLSLESNILYADGRPKMVSHNCKNMTICENAVRIINESLMRQQKESEIQQRFEEMPEDFKQEILNLQNDTEENEE